MLLAVAGVALALSARATTEDLPSLSTSMM